MTKRVQTPDMPSREELRRFGLLTGAIVAVLFGLLLPWIFGHGYLRWPWIVAGVLWVWGLLVPATLHPVYRGWMAFGHVLGWINTRIILGIMFYLMFVPAGFIMKLLRKDPMARKLRKETYTYRVKSHPLKKNHVERPY